MLSAMARVGSILAPFLVMAGETIPGTNTLQVTSGELVTCLQKKYVLFFNKKSPQSLLFSGQIANAFFPNFLKIIFLLPLYGNACSLFSHVQEHKINTLWPSVVYIHSFFFLSPRPFSLFPSHFSPYSNVLFKLQLFLLHYSGIQFTIFGLLGISGGFLSLWLPETKVSSKKLRHIFLEHFFLRVKIFYIPFYEKNH